jgi:hypothetical protein
MTQSSLEEVKKNQLKDKVDRLSKTVKQIEEPHNKQEAMAAMDRLLYLANIRALKEFLVDRDCKGEKPKLVVESPYEVPETGITEDRIFMPRSNEYNQDKLDMLKKQLLIPDDNSSTISDYSFLFEFNDDKKQEE